MTEEVPVDETDGNGYEHIPENKRALAAWFDRNGADPAIIDSRTSIDITFGGGGTLVKFTGVLLIRSSEEMHELIMAVNEAEQPHSMDWV